MSHAAMERDEQRDTLTQLLGNLRKSPHLTPCPHDPKVWHLLTSVGEGRWAERGAQLPPEL